MRKRRGKDTGSLPEAESLDILGGNILIRMSFDESCLKTFPWDYVDLMRLTHAGSLLAVFSLFISL